VIVDEPAVATYHGIRAQLDTLGADLRAVVTHPTYALPFLQPGRLVSIKHGALNFGWGVVVNYQKRLPAKVLVLWWSFEQLILMPGLE
jgi:ATP-dependent RNA helicase DOB1